MGTLRCPTCLGVLLEGGESRCPFCRTRLKTRKPVVLREASRITSRPTLAVERERKAKVAAEITAAEHERYSPATMARLETPHAPRLLATEAPPPPARVKRREHRHDAKPSRHGDAEPSPSLLDVLADYVVEGAPTRTVEPVVEPERVEVDKADTERVAAEMVAAVVVEPVADVTPEAVDEEVPAVPAEAAVAAPEKKVTGKTRSRLLRRRPMTPERRMDDALASLRVEVKVDALKRALEEPPESVAEVELAVEPDPEPEPELAEVVVEAEVEEVAEVDVEVEAEVAEAAAVEPTSTPIVEAEPVAERPIAPVDDIWPQYDDEPEAPQNGARRGWRIPWIARRAPDSTNGADVETLVDEATLDEAGLDDVAVAEAPVAETPVAEMPVAEMADADEPDAAVAALVESEELVAPIEADAPIADEAPIAADETALAVDDDRDELAARVETSIDALLAVMPGVVDEHLDEADSSDDGEAVASGSDEPLATAEEPIARVDAAVQALMALLPGTVEVAQVDAAVPDETAVDDVAVDETPIDAEEPIAPLAVETSQTDEAVDEPTARVEASVDALMALLEPPTPPATETVVAAPSEADTETPEPVAETPAVAPAPTPRRRRSRLTRRPPEVAPEVASEAAESDVASEVVESEVVASEGVADGLAVVDAPEAPVELATDRKVRRRRRSRLISRPVEAVDAPAAEPATEPVADVPIEEAPVEEARIEEVPVVEAVVDDVEAASVVASPKPRRRRWTTRRAPAADEPRTTLFDLEPVADRAEVVEAEPEPAESAVVAQTLDLVFDPVADADALAPKRRKRRIPKRSRRDDDVVPPTLFESPWPPAPEPVEPVASVVAEPEPEVPQAEPIVDVVAAGLAEAEIVGPEVVVEVVAAPVVEADVVEPEVVEPEVVEPDVDLTAEPPAERNGNGNGTSTSTGARGWRVRRGAKRDARPETPSVVAREVVVPEIVEEPAAASYEPPDGNGKGVTPEVVGGDRRGDGRVEIVDRRQPVHPSVQLPAQTRAVRVKTIKENGRRRWVVDVLVRQDEANNKRK